MKKILNLFLFGILTINLSAQIDTTEFKRYYSQSSKLEVISKYRELLLDNIVAMDKQKTRELLYYTLQQVENENYLALYPDEKWMICLLIGEYPLITSEMAGMDSTYYEKLINKVKPKEDQLYSILLKKIESYGPAIEKDISDNEEISLTDQSFYKLLIQEFSSESNMKNYRENLNKKATDFLNNFPGTPYELYVRNFIRYEFVPKSFSLGMEVYSGYALLSKGLKNYYNGTVPLGLGIIWGLDNFYLNTRMIFGSNKLKQEIQYNDSVWPQECISMLYDFELSLGYNYHLTKKICVSPVIGCGWASLSPSDVEKKDNKSLEDFEINAFCSPVLGFDISLVFDNFSSCYYGKMTHSYNAFALRYTYHPISFKKDYNYLNGAIHNLSVVYKFGYSGAKRVY